MTLTLFITTLLIALWNIITFLCPTTSLNNINKRKKPYFSIITNIYKYPSIIYTAIKKIINKIPRKQNNNSIITTPNTENNIYKTQNSVQNRISNSILIMNKALICANFLRLKKLKDAQATQILISKQHIFRPEDKCAYFSPFAAKFYHYLNNL